VNIHSVLVILFSLGLDRLILVARELSRLKAVSDLATAAA
jgi:hypothetical protein